MQKILSLFSVLLFVLSLALYSFPEKVLAENSTNTSKVVIDEIKLGGNGTPQEFVELYNQTSNEIPLAGWSLEYAKPAFLTSFCNAVKWTATGQGQNAKELTLPTSIPAFGILVVSGTGSSFTDSSGGSVRLIDNDGVVQDLVGWDKTSSLAPCLDNQLLRQPAVGPASGESVERYLDCETILPIDTNDNSADFAVSNTPSPGVLAGPLTNDCSPPDDGTGGGSGGGSGSDPEPQNSCDGIIISELLPNPLGADSGHEFIELHNPTAETINLSGCSLQLDVDTPKAFGDVSLPAGQYMAFDNTGIALPNSAGGTIYLLDSGSELQFIDYPGGLEDDVAWAWFGGDDWQQTYKPTPGEANIKQPTKPLEPCPAGKYRNPETNKCKNIETIGSSLKPCRADQFRNPLTNRCKLKDDGSSLQPCRPDQFRNPLTNRCKLISSASSSLKPCNPDQFRNPATNRCKKIDSGDSLKPCDPDQERNPETNRCRKVRGASTGDLTEVKDIEAPIVSGTPGWLLAGVAGGGVLSYAGWEWRREIMSLLTALRAKFPI